MKRFAVAVILSIIFVPLNARAGNRESMIVSAEWLASHLKDRNLVVLHVGPREGYDAAHIPGARHVATADLSLPRAEGALILELPPIDVLDAALEKLGISDDSRIVLYFGEDWVSPTTRIYFILDSIGAGDRTSVLNGGMRSWKAAGHPVTAEVPVVKPGRFTPKPRRDLVVDAAWVKANAGKPKVALIDARNTEYYDGTASGDEMRAGHIPGATSLPFESLVVEPALTFVERAAMQKLLADAGAARRDTVVPYCHIGQQATVVYFAARYLGYDVRLYDGSFQDWSRRAELPVETKP